VRCVNENRKKRKRLRWQATNHDCHCFDRAFLLAGACVCCVKISRNKRNKRKRQPIGMLGRSSGNHDWIAFECKPGFRRTTKLMLLMMVVVMGMQSVAGKLTTIAAL